MASRSPSVWQLEDDRPTEDVRTESTQLLIFALAFFLPLRTGFGLVELPSGTLAALALTAIGVFSAAPAHRRPPGWFAPLLAAVPLWMATTAVLNDQFEIRRLGTTAAWAGLAFVIGTGRVHAPSVARGAVTGLAAAYLTVLAGFAGQGSYGERLASWAGDPNTTAMATISVGLAAAAWVSTHRTRAFIVLALVALITFETESRTAWLALALALVWVLYLRTWNVFGAAATAWITVFTFENLPDSIKYWGPFAERTGSDNLRERILEIERIMVTERPWVGLGPGTARARLDGDTYFFHSSYLSARVEGGYILLAILLALLVLTFLRLSKAERSWRSGLVQSAMIGLAVTATNIGEALLTPSAATMLGLTMWWSVARARENGAEEAEDESAGLTSSRRAPDAVAVRPRRQPRR